VFENVKLAFQGIWSHKMRSLLTMLGIIIGIASIISIVSTIKGTNEQIKQNLVGSGTNAVTMTLYQNESPYEVAWNGIPQGVGEVTEAIRSQVSALGEVEDASLYRERNYVSDIFYQNTAFSGTLRGVDGHYLNVNNYAVQMGRGFSERDYRDHRRVVLVDKTAAKTLFLRENPIGKVVEIAKEPYTVVGLVEQRRTSEPVINTLEDYNLYMGETGGTMFVTVNQWPNIYRYEEPLSLCMKARSTDDMTSAGQKATKLVNKALHLGDDAEFHYQSNDISQQARKLQELSNATNMQLVWIASISLLVGGIGVMNIMLVSVTERTREIGLKKAIGAQESRILFQFLTEAAVLTSFGGILGVAGGIIMAKVISRLSETPMAVSVPASVLAVAFSMLIGVVFGLLPAVKAARLNPIDALRRE
jgi:putative ABC transport system permease protein